MTAIRTVLAGERYVSSKIAALVLPKTVDARQGSRNRAVENLTDRELQILRLLGAGLNIRKIARGLHVSFKTAETRRENIKHKLGLSDAVELVRYAANWGNGFKLSRNPSDLTPAGRPCH